MSVLGSVIARARAAGALLLTGTGNAAAAPPPPSTEIAFPTEKSPDVETIRIASVRKISRSYPSSTIDPNSFRDMCRDADVGFTWRLMELFDDVANDPRTGSLLRTRKLAVAGAAWNAEPGDDSDLAKRIADDAVLFTKRIPNFKQLRTDLLDAVFRGFACIQPGWEANGARWWMTSWKPIESRFFRFQDGDIPLVETVDAPSGKPLPPGTIFAVWRDKPGTISRSGIGRALTKLFIYKLFALVDTAGFIETFGKPFITVEVPRNIPEGSPELERAKNAAASIMTDQVGLVPPGVTIQFLEAVGKAGTVRDVFLAFIGWIETAEAICTVGAELTTASGDGGLGHGQEAKEHGKVRQDIKEDDGAWLDDVITTQIYAPWTAYHYGPTAPVPRFVSDVGAPVNEAQQNTAKQTRAQTLGIIRSQLKVPLSKKQVKEEFDLQEPTNDDDTIAPPAEAALAPGSVLDPETMPGDGTAQPQPGQVPPQLTNRDGACPHCGGFFTLSEAQKKKRSLLSVTSRS